MALTFDSRIREHGGQAFLTKRRSRGKDRVAVDHGVSRAVPRRTSGPYDSPQRGPHSRRARGGLTQLRSPRDDDPRTCEQSTEVFVTSSAQALTIYSIDCIASTVET